MDEQDPGVRRSSDVLDAIWDKVTATPERPDSARVLFRAKALDKLDVAADVDNQLPLVSRRTWLLLVGVAVLVAAFALWASLTPSVTSIGAAGRVTGSPGVLPVVAASAGITTGPIAEAGDVVAVGDTVASVRTPSGTVPVITDQAGTVWQVGVIPGDAVAPGSLVVSLLPPGSDATAILAVPETSSGAVVPGLAVTIIGTQNSSGTVEEVSAPLTADDASARTGLTLEPGINYSLVTVGLGGPLPQGSAISAQIILSDSTVIGRLLGDS